MSKHGTIKRYTLIFEKIGRNQYPSFDIIKDYLFDIEQIRFEFGIEIKYDRNRNGYFIDAEHQKTARHH